MTGIQLILLAAALLAVSGVPGLFGMRRSSLGERVAVVATAIAAVLGMVGALMASGMPSGGPDESLQWTWGLPLGQFAVSLDSVTRVFLLPVLLIPALGAIYGLGYWKQSEHPKNGRKLRLFYGLLPAAMVIVLVARDSVLFLLAWEVMALSAFFLVTTEDDQAEARSAGWVYFVASHAGTMALFAMFALLRYSTGTFALVPIDPARITPTLSNAIFLLGVVGFGLKAGLMPLHVWLPSAHSSAPSHVSAVLSGVMLKIGIYGLFRMTYLLPLPPIWWGATLLSIGAVSAVVALAFAIGQHDLKRLLAYSSIENVGIITVGLGLALIGRTTGQPAWAALGLGGAILHVWNHSLFKPLLFLGAGSVLHGASERHIDRLGGLARRMPQTAVFFLVGAVAICALPPLNGFVSELMIYLGLFRTLGPSGGNQWQAAAAAIPALALAGGLAAAAFAKLFGTVFLGEPRTEPASLAHESPRIMIGPMAILAILCVALGIVPAAAAPLIDSAVATWWSGVGTHVPSIASVAPLGWLPFVSLTLLALAGVGFVYLRRAMTRTSAPRPRTWDCGYAAGTARMQYTGSSFGQLLVGLFAWALWPRIERMTLRVLFPTSAPFRSEVPDTVLDRAVLPVVRVTTGFLRRARLLQQGRTQAYVLYVILTVLALLLSMTVL